MMVEKASSLPGLYIIKSGRGWIALEKPAGMSVHNDPGRDLISRVPELLAKDPGRAFGQGAQQVPRIQPVHRLDRHTSGVILLATDPQSVGFLSRAFQENRVEKRYVALVHGRLQVPGEKSNPHQPYFLWNWPLTKKAAGRADPRGRGKRVNAQTRVRLLRQSPHYALLEIALLTGRKHQIRRHAALAGHPVTGDTRYASKRSVDWLAKNRNYHRLGLHSHSLTFTPGDRSELVTVTTAGFPPEMLRLIESDI